MNYRVLAMLEKNKEALEAYSEGLTTKEVAERIGMNKRTLEKRISNMLEATGKNTTLGLVIYAIENKIISICQKKNQQ